MTKRGALGFITSYVFMTLAGILYAVAFCRFFQPNAISAGGFTGISQILNHFFPVLPVGVTTVVLNIPLFIIAGKRRGARLILSSLYCMATSTLFIDIVAEIHEFAPMDDLMLASVFGGALLGLACGIQLKLGATNGGTELAARLLKLRFRHISVGKLCLAVDLAVIAMYALTFRRVENALYGVVSMYVFSLAVDFVIYGGTHAKMAYIISGESERIREALIGMDLGITMVTGRGGFSGDERQLVLCVFKRAQIAAIKEAVIEIDPASFIVVCEAHEVLGEGFGKYNPDDL